MLDTVFMILGIVFALIIVLAIVGVKTGVIKMQVTKNDE